MCWVDCLVGYVCECLKFQKRNYGQYNARSSDINLVISSFFYPEKNQFITKYSVCLLSVLLLFQFIQFFFQSDEVKNYARKDSEQY